MLHATLYAPAPVLSFSFTQVSRPKKKQIFFLIPLMMLLLLLGCPTNIGNDEELSLNAKFQIEKSTNKTLAKRKTRVEKEKKIESSDGDVVREVLRAKEKKIK